MNLNMRMRATPLWIFITGSKYQLKKEKAAATMRNRNMVRRWLDDLNPKPNTAIS